MNWIDRWIKRRADKLADAEALASRPQLTRVMSEEADKYRDSKEPWVTIIGDTVSDDGIQIALDWNDAFISFLSSQGVTGADDTQIVQKWLAMIAQQTSEKLASSYTDTDGNVSDYAS